MAVAPMTFYLIYICYIAKVSKKSLKELVLCFASVTTSKSLLVMPGNRKKWHKGS